MELKDSKTKDNLRAAFAGESEANRRYLYFAQKADIEGANEVAQIFETNLNQYKIVYDKTFVQGGKYRSYIVIEYKLDT